MLIFTKQFKGIGKIPGQHNIELKERATPVQLPARNLPEALEASEGGAG